ncbi:MAG: hypothetical protein IT267_07175 [Saprospiraceae bacterium]|nr:hypothetical protein [Saprospiraceae bacterium]
MNRTGEKCKQTGIYYCQSHKSNEIAIAKGDTFPPCQTGGAHGTTWILKTPS